MAREWGTPKGWGCRVWLPLNLSRKSGVDDGQISGMLVFNVPPRASSPRLMHLLCPGSAPCPCPHVSSPCRWHLSSWLSISGPSCPPASDADGYKLNAWAGQGDATSFPRLTPGLGEAMLCHRRRWRRERAALNKSFLTAGKCRGLCDGAELTGDTAPWLG